MAFRFVFTSNAPVVSSPLPRSSGAPSFIFEGRAQPAPTHLPSSCSPFQFKPLIPLAFGSHLERVGLVAVTPEFRRLQIPTPPPSPVFFSVASHGTSNASVSSPLRLSSVTSSVMRGTVRSRNCSHTICAGHSRPARRDAQLRPASRLATHKHSNHT
eukprot:scaffold5032_cov88-Isochrysis_galbana.AAC.5